MKETTLLRIALTCIALGMPLLYIITDAHPAAPPPISISGIVGQNNGTTITLEQTVNTPQTLDIPEGKLVKATGRWNKGIFYAQQIAVN